jgi:hypothetical protein
MQKPRLPTVHAANAYSIQHPKEAHAGIKMPQIGSSLIVSLPSMTTNDCPKLKKLSPGTHPTTQFRQSV